MSPKSISISEVSGSVPINLSELYERRNLSELYERLPEDRPFRTSPSIRRIIYGLPHGYRRGDTQERRSLMGTFLGAEFITAGVVGLVTALWWSHQSFDKVPFAATATAGAFAGIAIVTLRKLIPPWAYHFLLLAGGALIAVGARYSGELALSVGVFFVLGSGYSFTFFYHWRAALYLVLATGAYWIVLGRVHVDAPWSGALYEAAAALVMGVSLSVTVSRESAFRTAAETLQLRRLRAFRTLSHSLRVPLSQTISISDALLLGFDGTTDQKSQELIESLNAIRDASNGLLGQAEQYLDLTKSQAGLLQLHAFRRGINEILDPVERRFKAMAAQKGVGLQFDRSNLSVNEIVLDQPKVEQIIDNLLDNALKACGPNDAILLIASSNESELCIDVADSGCGIPPDRIATIFDEFAQADDLEENLRQTGWGIGLSVAREYARLHDGELTLLSTELSTSKTTFRLLLPVTPKVTATDAQIAPIGEAAPIRKVAPERRGRPWRILVVDDEPLSLVSARMTLRQRGLRVVEADSKAKAMDALRSVRDLDLVLLDIRGLNGPEVLKSIRKLSITQAQIPVVAFTAFYDEDSPNIFASMGFDGYLPKPIPQEGLPLEIGQLISNWRVRRVQIERDKRRPR